MCDWHSAQVSIAALLAGKPQGHGMRWAKHFKDTTSHKDDPAVRALMDQLDDAKVAQRFGLTPLSKYDSHAALEKDLVALRAYGEHFPVKSKYEVLDWFLDVYIDAGRFELFLHAVVASRPTSADAAKLEVWVPSQPMLFLIEGSSAEKSKAFRQRTLGAFAAIMRKGRIALDDFGKFLQLTLQFLDQNMPTAIDDDDNDEDAFDDDIEIVLQATKAMRLLICLGPSSMSWSHLQSLDHLSAIIQARELKGSKMKDYPEAALAKTIADDDGVYNEKSEMLENYMVAFRTEWPLVLKADEELKQCCGLTDACTIPKTYFDCLAIVVRTSVALPDGMCHEFESLLCSKTKELVDEMVAVLEGKKLLAISNERRLALEKDGFRLLKEATKNLPRMRPEWHAVTKAMEAVRNTTLQNDLVSRLRVALDQITDATPTAAALDVEHDPMSQIMAEVRASMELPSQFLVPLVDVVARVVHIFIARCINAGTCDKWLPLALGLTECMPCDAHPDIDVWKLQCDQAEKASALTSARLSFIDRGEDVLARLLGSPDADLKAWRGAMKLADESKLKSRDEGAHAYLVSELDASLAQWSEVTTKLMQLRLDACNAKELAAKQHLEKAGWPVPVDVAEKDFDAFLEDAAFLKYPDAAALATATTELESSQATLKSTVELCENGADAPDSLATDTLCTCLALVWSVKTIKKVKELADTGVKLTRFCKKQAALLQPGGKGHALAAHVPAALTKKLEMAKTL